MEYRRLGKSGLQVSALSLGSWLTFGKQIENTTAEALMRMAYDAGINFFDNAEIYSNGQSEVVMGKILKKMKWTRSSYLVSSKVFFGTMGAKSKPNERGLSRKHVIEGCHAALKRLQVDYIDLFFCHRPDKNTPISETVWAMNDLIRQGKILYWGTSEWSAAEIVEAIHIAHHTNLIPPVMEQPQYNMMVREKMEKEYLHVFNYHSYGTTVWSPLASGVLSGKYNKAKKPSDTRLEMDGMQWLKKRVLTTDQLTKAGQLQHVAQQLNITLPVLAIAWVLKNQYVSTAILGASKPMQLKENLSAINAVSLLTDEIMEAIEKILDNKPELAEY
jgi:voltage-dependent potassium channel beta subunit